MTKIVNPTGPALARLKRATAVIAAVVAICGLATGCRTSPREKPPEASASRPAPATSTQPPVYRAQDKLCDAIDFASLEQIVGTTTGVVTQQDSRKSSPATFMLCSKRLGNPGHQLVVSVHVVIVAGASTQPQYEKLRRTTQTSNAVTDVPGLGQGAYSYIDHDIAPNVVVYDNNLYLEIAVLDRAATPTPRNDITAAMIEAIRQTLPNLTH